MNRTMNKAIYFDLLKNDGEKVECRLSEGNWEKFDGMDYFIEFDIKKEFPGLNLQELRDALYYGENGTEYDLGEGYLVRVCPDEHTVNFKLICEQQEDVEIPVSLLQEPDLYKFEDWAQNLPYFAEGRGEVILQAVSDSGEDDCIVEDYWRDSESLKEFGMLIDINHSDAAESEKTVVVRLINQSEERGCVDLEDEVDGLPKVYFEDGKGFYHELCPYNLDFYGFEWGLLYYCAEYEQKHDFSLDEGDYMLIINEGD